MAVALSSSRCLNAVTNALKAVRSGKPSKAAIILHSVQNDARFLEEELWKYYKKLQSIERKHEEKADKLTKEINQLYQQERELQKEERELKGLKDKLSSQNERYVENLNKAQRRYTQAGQEGQKAQERHYNNLNLLFLLPLIGLIIYVLIEAVEENARKASEASRDMDRYGRTIDEANDDIRITNSMIRKLQIKIQQAQRRAQELRAQRDSCHNELGVVKSITVFILDASKVSREIITLTQQASVKTESLENIMRLAAKKNTLKILRSGGTQTKVGSFKECWEEIEEMMKSNNLIYLDDEDVLE